MKMLILLMLLLLQINLISAQIPNYRSCIIAFYNLENFYDTIDNPIVNDDDFTPKGIKHYNSHIYLDKVNKLASVISSIGKEIIATGPSLIGVAELENDTVLTDLVHHPLLVNRQYEIIHFDSKDARGIDVALLYDPKYFLPEKAQKLVVDLPSKSKNAFYTRDILYVKGLLAGETIHVYVNHWPSRRGGEIRSIPARRAAALTCKKHMETIFSEDKMAKIIIMGDLNDDPDSPSITEVLKAKKKLSETGPGELYNPWAELYEKGIGTLANRDSWGLFDQIILSGAWLQKPQKGLFYQKQYIFNQLFLKENTGRFKGYPMRTWDGNTYRGGYSDHFPTYILLLKNIN